MGQWRFWHAVDLKPEDVENKIGRNNYVMGPFNPANFLEIGAR